jgi:hypothetical protein
LREGGQDRGEGGDEVSLLATLIPTLTLTLTLTLKLPLTLTLPLTPTLSLTLTHTHTYTHSHTHSHPHTRTHTLCLSPTQDRGEGGDEGSLLANACVLHLPAPPFPVRCLCRLRACVCV